MKKILFFLTLILTSTVINAQTSIEKSDKIIVTDGKKLYLHKVEKGQTLYAISRAYGISVKNIAKENGDISLKIRTGQVLKIPAVTTTEQDKPDFHWHKVSTGQTLYSIAKKYGVSINDIARHNSGAESGLHIGQILKIPNTDKKDSEFEDDNFFYHPVQSGETLFSIAQLYGTTLAQIRKFNPETKNGLKAGQALAIPKGNYDFTERLPLVYENFPEAETYGYDPLYFEQSGVTPCKSYTYNKNTVFNVALMLPLHSDKNDWKMSKYKDEKDKLFYKNTQKFIEFYEGFLLALQRLKIDGISVNLYLYDTENSTDKVKQILARDEFNTMDLIVGPVYSKNVNIAARFAKKNKVNLITPLTQKLSLLENNPFLFEVMPSAETRVKVISNYLTNMYDSSIVIIHNGTKEEKQMIDIYKRKLVRSFSSRSDLKEVVLKNVNYKKIGSENLDDALSVGMDNIILIPSSNEVFVTKVIEKLHLHAKHYNIKVIGEPSWEFFQNVNIEQLQDLSFNYASPYYIDYNNWQVQSVVKKYRESYQTDPSIYAMQGYDIASYFCGALKRYGKHFQFCISPENKVPQSKGIIYDFDFVRYGTKNGFENNGVFMLHYGKGLELKKTN